MIYCIWVMNMASRYKFSEEQIKEIEQARKDNKAMSRVPLPFFLFGKFIFGWGFF